MSNTKKAGPITGKISASPNPIYFGQGVVVISWETNDPAGGEVRVTTHPDDEKVVSKSKSGSGQTEISWIVDSTIYEFRLYAASQPHTPIDSVEVRRALDTVPAALLEIADEAMRGNVSMVELAHFIAALIPAYLQTGTFRHVFPVLLRELATDVMHGKIGAPELSQFVATVTPKYLNNSIAGKIIATPNPVPFWENSVLISWGTNDPTGGEVRVLDGSDDEKLLCRGASGEMKVPWISGLQAHEFRLYAGSQPDKPIDSVIVKRDFESVPVILHQLAGEASRGNIDVAELSRFVATVIPICFRSESFREFFPVVLREVGVMRETIDMIELSQFIATLVPHCLHSKEFHETFRLWERKGFHVTPVHFYQPIPDTQNLPKTLWDRPSTLAGIDMNDSMQLDLLRKHFPRFRNEYERFPTKPSGKPPQFHLDNGLFGGLDALVAYCIIRHFEPRLIIEIGGGFSTLLLTEAAGRNKTSDLTCIEPFPQEFLKRGFPGLARLIEKKVQDIDLEFFSELHSGDVLFIDSSHTVKIGGDVNYLFLEVLPRLRPGVIVHVHDIFLPFEYRRDWVLDEFRFWSEQYLLQAFLTYNSDFEVLMANSYMAHKYVEDIKAAFPSLEKLETVLPNSVRWGGGSFWVRRKSLRG